jgi:predicted XRE-type DNA-binding protein
MNRHLDQIRDLWFKTRPYNVTILVSIQKELFSGHFLFGKIDAVELEPLRPNQLVEAYKGFWQTSEPFTPDALLLLAQLSRGIFRRFMKYIQACIEKHVITEAKQERIDIELVNKTITFDQVVKDMDLELSDIFKRSEQKLEAVKLLDFLRQNDEANQKQIAEGTGISEPTVSRLMQKLEAHRYVIRRRDVHGQWLTRLRF